MKYRCFSVKTPDKCICTVVLTHERPRKEKKELFQNRSGSLECHCTEITSTGEQETCRVVLCGQNEWNHINLAKGQGQVAALGFSILPSPTTFPSTDTRPDPYLLPGPRHGWPPLTPLSPQLQYRSEPSLVIPPQI